MIIILNHNILGRLIYKMAEDKEIHVFGVDKDQIPGKPIPFFVGQNKTTNKIFSGYKTVNPKSKTIQINRDSSVEEKGVLAYARPESFIRNDMTSRAFINPPILWPAVKDFHPGNVMSIRMTKEVVSKKSVVEIHQLNSKGEIKIFNYHSEPLSLKIFITLPIKYYFHRDGNMGIIFDNEYQYTSNRDYYHIYQYQIMTDKNLKTKNDDYTYVEDHFFKRFLGNYLLKRIVHLNRSSRLTFDHEYAFQFLTKKILNFKGLMDLGLRIGALCQKNKFRILNVKKLGIEFKKRDKKLIKLQEILAREYNIKLLGRFCMQDHSRLHNNLAEAEKFLKGG